MSCGGALFGLRLAVRSLGYLPVVELLPDPARLQLLADRPDPVPDEIWDEAAWHYDEEELAALLLSIATTNVFNRLNAPTRQIAGAWG